MTRPDWFSDIDFSKDKLPDHLAHPEISIDDYICSEHVKLGARTMNFGRVYLDQNYWNYCRDAARGIPQQPEHLELYEILKREVKNGRIICPASHLILEETLKQSDVITRHLTSKIVQELSKGIALQPHPVLTQFEILYFLKTLGLGDEEACSPEQCAWTYVGNLFGHMRPHTDSFDEETLCALQKSWFDFHKSIPFSALEKAMAPMPEELRSMLPEFYESQNAQCELHRNDYSSFKQLFQIEIWGGLDAHKNDFSSAIWGLYQEVASCYQEKPKEGSEGDKTQQLLRIVHQAFKLNRITTQLSGIKIMAGIHAAIRYKQQKYKRGDHHDHFHARVALPYCDVFLTEKNLGTLLTTKPLEYDVLYNCEVAWKPEDALATVTRLLNSG